MRCHYFDAGRCRSCGLMGTPYRDQLATKQADAAALLAPVAPGLRWDEPFAGPESGYRNKAKWVVGGSIDAPTIGILDEHREGIDLRECGICEPALRTAFPVLADAITSIGLPPYQVDRRRGEFKYLIVTASPDGQLMVRFVLRSPAMLPAVRAALPALRRALPALTVLSVNLHPEHKAVVEGDQEIVLTEQATLPMRLNGITLQLRPQGFFQTNTTVAAALYRQAGDWSAAIGPATVLDLYCGVGGFALHCATEGTHRIRGIDTTADAVAGATVAAGTLPDPGRFSFLAGDATAGQDLDADLVIVNPPRRGIGADLAERLERGRARHLIYSSCNPATLATDLAAMPSLRPLRARLFDMFPQTRHVEVAVLLGR